MYANVNGSTLPFASAIATGWKECGAKRTPLTAATGAAAVSGVRFAPHSFQPVAIADAKGKVEPFTFAYISDSHLYKRELNDRFVRQLLRAVDDINAMDPQPDFVLYGGDLAQLGQREELDLGAQILKSIKAPVHMMVGEHDWFLDTVSYTH